MKIINQEGICPMCKSNISYKASLQGTIVVQCWCEECKKELKG